MRRVWKVLKWILLGLLLLAASWVAFNGPWADAPARPRPALLTPPPLQVGEPSAYALLLESAAAKSVPTTPPWQCAPKGDCTLLWLAQSGALREQLNSMAEFGRTCETAAADGVSWIEPFPALQDKNPAATPIPQYKNITSCLQWLRAQATLAAVGGDEARALRLLQQGDRIVRSAMLGAQSLIGHAIAWNVATRQWQAVAAIAQARPKMAPQLLELLHPLDPSTFSTARWIAHESDFSSAVMRDLIRSCEAVRRGEDTSQGKLDSLWCHGHLGLLPELTAQEMDAYFVRMAEQSREGAVATAAAGVLGSESPSSPWAWRNSVGHILAVVGSPSWMPYVHRQADVELVRQAAELAVKLTIHPLPDAQRQAWLDSQDIPPAIKQRLSLADGRLNVRPWHEDGEKQAPVSFALLSPARSP